MHTKESWSLTKLLTLFKGGLCSLHESEPRTEVTAFIFLAKVLRFESIHVSSGRKGKAKGTGRLLLQSNMSGDTVGILCFVKLVFPLILQYL